MNIPMKSSHRSINADVIRIIAMLMIIVMHTFLSFTLRPDFFQTPIYFLLEPISVVSNSGVLLFFILSGYLVVGKKRSIKDNLKKTAIKLGIPFVFFAMINLLISIQQIFTAHLGMNYFISDLLKQILKFPNSSLWFLIVLMSLYALNPVWELVFASDETKKQAMYLLKSAFIFTFLITLAEYLTGHSQPASPIFNNFTAWLGYACFYLYGAAAKRSWVNIQNQKLNFTLITLGFVLSIGSNYFSKLLAQEGISYFWLNYNQSTTSPAVAMIAIGIFNQLMTMNLQKFKSQALIYLSQLSFGIYLIHTNVVALLTTYIGFDFDHITMNIYLYNIVNFSLVLGLSIILAAIMHKTKGLKMLIGS